MRLRTAPDAPVAWIPRDEPAIDFDRWDESARKAYFSPGEECDYTLPPIRPGEKPFTVYFRPMSVSDYMRISALMSQHASPFEAADVQAEILRATVVRIEGAGELRDGVAVEVPPERLVREGVLTDEGLSFFSHPLLALEATIAAWIVSCSRYGRPGV